MSDDETTTDDQAPADDELTDAACGSRCPWSWC
jgi:hypothetical protein